MWSAALIIAAVLLLFIVSQFYRTYWNIPPVPTSENSMCDMLALAALRPGERIADFGAGDGRLVAAFARAGAEAHGYESNLFLVLYARRKLKHMGVHQNAHIHWKNFWNIHAAQFDAIAIYGMPSIMKPLERKLRAELKPGARVLSNYFEFPTWPAARTQNDIHLYRQS